VDNLAKQAINHGISFQLLPISEINNVIKLSSFDDWKISYPTSFQNPHSWYLKCQPHLSLKPWYSIFRNFSRSVIIKISRLRFGHNRLPPHLHRVGLSPSPHCPLHPSDPQIANLNHLFFNCPQLRCSQMKLYKSLLNAQLITPITASDILSQQHIQIFSFIAEFLQSLPPEINI